MLECFRIFIITTLLLGAPFILCQDPVEIEIDFKAISSPVRLNGENIKKELDVFAPWVIVFQRSGKIDPSITAAAQENEGLVRIGVADMFDDAVLDHLVRARRGSRRLRI